MVMIVLFGSFGSPVRFHMTLKFVPTRLTGEHVWKLCLMPSTTIVHDGTTGASGATGAAGDAGTGATGSGVAGSGATGAPPVPTNPNEPVHEFCGSPSAIFSPGILAVSLEWSRATGCSAVEDGSFRP